MEIPLCEGQHTKAPLQTAQIILSRERVNDKIIELNFGLSEGHMGVNKTWIRPGKGTTGSRRETMLRSGASSEIPVQPVTAPEPGIWTAASEEQNGPVQKDSHRCSMALPMELSRKPIPPDHCGLRSEGYVIPNEEDKTVAEALVTNFFCGFGVLREPHGDQGRNFKSRLMQEV
jgi:hypothetical protein